MHVCNDKIKKRNQYPLKTNNYQGEIPLNLNLKYQTTKLKIFSEKEAKTRRLDFSMYEYVKYNIIPVEVGRGTQTVAKFKIPTGT